MSATALAWVITYLLHSTVVIAGAWLLSRVWGDKPERMSAVWKAALVGGVLTATIQVGLGVTPLAGQLALPSTADPSQSLSSHSHSESTAGVPALHTPAVGSALSPSSGAAVVERSGPTPEGVPASDATESALAPDVTEPSPAALGAVRTPPAAAEASARPGSQMLAVAAPWILGLLALGAVLGLLSVVASVVALKRSLRGRALVSQGALRTTLDHLLTRAGLRRVVPLADAPAVRMPMAVGVLKPQIVVPREGVDSLSPGHQRGLLAHELAHVVRRDPAWRLLAVCIQRVLFFQPLNIFAARQLSQVTEYACDDWAARHTEQPIELASCLAEIASWVAPSQRLAATMAEPRSILGRRVQRLLRPSTQRVKRPAWLPAVLVLPLVGLVAVVPGATACPEPCLGSPTVVIISAPEVDHRSIVVVPAEHAGAEPVVVIEQPVDGALRSVARERRRHAAVDNTFVHEAARARHDARRALREARRELAREARRVHEAPRVHAAPAVPSHDDIEALLQRAHAQARDARRPHRRERHSEPMVLRVRPGRIEFHGQVPLSAEDLAQLQAHGELTRAELRRLRREIDRELSRVSHEMDERSRHLDIVLRGGDDPFVGGLEIDVYDSMAPEAPPAGSDECPDRSRPSPAPRPRPLVDPFDEERHAKASAVAPFVPRPPSDVTSAVFVGRPAVAPAVPAVPRVARAPRVPPRPPAPAAPVAPAVASAAAPVAPLPPAPPAAL